MFQLTLLDRTCSRNLFLQCHSLSLSTVCFSFPSPFLTNKLPVILCYVLRSNVRSPVRISLSAYCFSCSYDCIQKVDVSLYTNTIGRTCLSKFPSSRYATWGRFPHRYLLNMVRFRLLICCNFLFQIKVMCFLYLALQVLAFGLSLFFFAYCHSNTVTRFSASLVGVFLAFGEF